MTCKRSFGATLILLAASACGAGGIAVDETGSASETAADESDPGDGDGDPGDGDGDGDPSAESCIEDGQLTRALAIADPITAQVHVFEPGGVERVLPAPLPEGVDAPAYLWVVTSPGFIAVVTSYAIYVGPDHEEGSILRLYERHSGALLWSKEFTDRRLGQVFVDAQGRVVGAYGWSAEEPPAGVMVIDGQLTKLPGFVPARALGDADWMPGWFVDELGEYLGAALAQPFAGEFVQVTDSTGWRPGDQSVEYIDDQAPVPAFVIARPEGSEQIVLDPFAGLDGSVHELGRAGDYRLVALTPGDDGPPVLVRVQLSTKALLELNPPPPPGLEPFDCYFPRPTVDVAGRLLVELRDAGAAQIHAWDPASDSWSALGVPMTAVDDIDIEARVGRVELIRGHGANTTFCLPTEWSNAPADAIAGSSLQLARLDPPLSVVIDALPFSSVSVDPSERCATWTDATGQVVRDLDDDDELELSVDGAAIWLE